MTKRRRVRGLPLAIGAWVLCGVASAATPAPVDKSALVKLPYQLTTKHLGVATCSSSVCHGNVKSTSNYDVQLNEYMT